MAEIAELVDREIVKHRRHLNLPKFIFKPAARLVNNALWWHTVSADEVEREFIDQKIDPTAKTFKDLGMEPAELSGLTYHYLVGLPLTILVLRISRLTVCITARVSQLGFLRSTSGNGT